MHAKYRFVNINLKGQDMLVRTGSERLHRALFCHPIRSILILIGIAFTTMMVGGIIDPNLETTVWTTMFGGGMTSLIALFGLLMWVDTGRFAEFNTRISLQREWRVDHLSEAMTNWHIRQAFPKRPQAYLGTEHTQHAAVYLPGEAGEEICILLAERKPNGEIKVLEGKKFPISARSDVDEVLAITQQACEYYSACETKAREQEEALALNGAEPRAVLRLEEMSRSTRRSQKRENEEFHRKLEELVTGR